jgi:hypothetical protein
LELKETDLEAFSFPFSTTTAIWGSAITHFWVANEFGKFANAFEPIFEMSKFLELE